ncbi:MAG: hypothetical protein ATN32_06710 [Candidatus Epulonipiscium fishelsonii]|nr:MAG: hypothetical protein ATN32_06710 [Epulopiscium sp. AS2M-Bin002]
MISITYDLVLKYVPDKASEVAANKLVKDATFFNHGKNSAENVFFADCLGSGLKPYFVSIDFTVANNPIFRCNCPSRKLPCKHSIGLLIELSNKKSSDWIVQELPENLAKKVAKKNVINKSF